MKKFLLLFFLFILFCFQVDAQVKLKFIIYSNNISDTSAVFITGNHPLLGGWNPSSISLIKINDTTWNKEIEFGNDENLEFKFTLGGWDKEGLDSSGNIFPNFRHITTADTTLIFTFPSWGTQAKEIKGQITGNVRYHRKFGGKEIQARDIIIWLPPSYEHAGSKRYPVLYMHDGQNIIDPLTSSIGVDWQIDESADSLIKNNLISELIIVGIYNTNLRGLEYSYSPLGKAYMNFIVEELKPFIDNTYRTLPDKKNTATCGSSLGGLISFMLVWEYDSVFSKAACLSPAFKIDRFDYVAPVKGYNGVRKNIKLYIDNGGKGVDKKLQPGIEEMLNELLNLGYEQNKDIMWVEDIEAEHSESAWAKRVPGMLKFLFPFID